MPGHPLDQEPPVDDPYRPEGDVDDAGQHDEQREENPLEKIGVKKDFKHVFHLQGRAARASFLFKERFQFRDGTDGGPAGTPGTGVENRTLTGRGHL